MTEPRPIKLDDILISDKVANPLYDQPFEIDDPEYLELKQQIKDLINDLIGPDQKYDPQQHFKVAKDSIYWRNSLRAELRQKVEGL